MKISLWRVPIVEQPSHLLLVNKNSSHLKASLTNPSVVLSADVPKKNREVQTATRQATAAEDRLHRVI